MIRQLVFVLCACLVLSVGASAEQIGWVTIEDDRQAEIAGDVVDHPYLRVNNRFLTGFDESQLQAFMAAGLSVDVLMKDADPTRVYRVLPDGLVDSRAVDVKVLGETIDLGGGMTLLSAGSIAASSLSDHPGYLVTPLAELESRWLYVPAATAGGLSGALDFPTDSLVDLVSQDSLFAFDTRLREFQTRYIWTDSIDAARDWMVQKFLDWGYTDVSIQPFSWNGGTHYNVVCVKDGVAEPDVTIVVGGHYDSINFDSDPLVFAPGADDNGSGTAAILEIARILKDVPLRKTIVFMPFSAEEVGLVGSNYAAQDFAAQGTNVEVMFNFDMIGYDPDNLGLLSLAGAPFNRHYRDFAADVSGRLTSLAPVPEESPGGSDHQSFINQGFPVVFAIEGTFNYGGWHTDFDITSRMNFQFMTEVVKVGIASVAAVANAAHPTEIERIVDPGDGTSLEVIWTDCDPTYDYFVRFGTQTGVYTDSVAVPQGECSLLLEGLTEGQRYFLSVVGVTTEGYNAIYAPEDSLTPLLIPRKPNALKADPSMNSVVLDWADNPEGDLAGYNIYRSYAGLPYALHQSNIQESQFTDIDVISQTEYSYKVTAVDNDGYESEFSDTAGSAPATFDGGILVVDEISQGTGVPTQEGQEAFFDTIFDGSPYGMTQVEGTSGAVTRSTLGQYSSIFWFDDDLAQKNISNSEDTLAWYLDITGDMFVCGLRTLQFWGSSNINPGSIRYDEFGLESFTDNSAFDFAGAHGQDGWPDLEVDPGNFFGGPLGYIPSMTPTAGTEVIYTYDAASDDPSREGTPVGLLKQTPRGYRLMLSFPVGFLTDSTAKELITYAKTVFGEGDTTSVPGDVNGSGLVDVSDLTYLIDFLFRGGPAPTRLNRADANADCKVVVSDLTYLVDFVFLGGPDPLMGCAE